MKKLLLLSSVLLLFTLFAYSQSSDELNGVKVYTLEGWIVKAINNNSYNCKYSFSYDTEGTNSSGEVVSTTSDTFGPSTINANEEKQLFTAPQDPNKKITYKITNIKMLTSEKVASSGGGRRRM